VAGDVFRIVGFSVTPQSIKHSFLGEYKWNGDSTDVFNNTDVYYNNLATYEQK